MNNLVKFYCAIDADWDMETPTIIAHIEKDLDLYKKGSPLSIMSADLQSLISRSLYPHYRRFINSMDVSVLPDSELYLKFIEQVSKLTPIKHVSFNIRDVTSNKWSGFIDEFFDAATINREGVIDFARAALERYLDYGNKMKGSVQRYEVVDDCLNKFDLIAVKIPMVSPCEKHGYDDNGNVVYDVDCDCRKYMAVLECKGYYK